MARLRYNGLSNSLGAELASSATSITFASKLTYAGGDVPTITGSDYIPLSILDTDGNCVEVVHLTSYTAEATTGTVARNKEDGTDATRASGSVVVNGPSVDDLTFVGVSVAKTVTQSIALNTWTPVTFGSGTEQFDTHGFHDTSTNTDRLTVPSERDGSYLLTGFARFAADPDGFRYTRYTINGTEVTGSLAKIPAASAGVTPAASPAMIVSLAVGDIVRLEVQQADSGAALNIDQAAITIVRLAS